MSKIDNFILSANLCWPYIGISKFFSETALMWWTSIGDFTKFTYKKDPTLTAQQVFDQYIRSLVDIATIKQIDPNVVQRIHNLCKNIIVWFIVLWSDLLVIFLDKSNENDLIRKWNIWKLLEILWLKSYEKMQRKTIVLSESYLYVHYTLAKEKKN